MCKHGTQFMAYHCACWVCAQEQRPRPLAARAGRMFGKIVAQGIMLGLLAAWAIGSVHAKGRGLHVGHAQSEMALHDQFYSKWMQPPQRTTSCCNKEDCHPTMVVMEHGVCKAWKLPSKGIGWDSEGGEITLPPQPAHWVVFDCALLEENQPDPEESPDGRSHACIAKYTDQVYCAARGSLQ